MVQVVGRTDEEWASAISQAYAAQTKPPLTDKLKTEVKALVERVIHGRDLFERDCADRVNDGLDAFERRLNAAVGPRIVSIDRETWTITVKHRSEAARPTRSFGGQ